MLDRENRHRIPGGGVKIIKLVLFLAVFGAPLAATQSTPAGAGSRGAATECTGMADLVAFIVNETGYPQLHGCPRVSTTTDAVLKSMLALKARADGEEPLAMYVPAGAEILLHSDVDLTSPLGQSYLVHELVHALQFENSATAQAPCPGWLEGEAYRVQARYLRILGLAKDASTVEFFGLLQGACAQTYHPELTVQ